MPNRRIAIFRTLAAALMLAGGAATAMTVKPYSSGALAAAQNAGGGVALHFHAPWCPTCREQDKVLDKLKADPALDKLTLLRVNYDSTKPLRKSMKVDAQSTFVVFKGKAEVARSSGETDPANIRSTLMRGL